MSSLFDPLFSSKERAKQGSDPVVDLGKQIWVVTEWKDWRINNNVLGSTEIQK